MKEYKIVTVKDRWFWGRFAPERLEEELNAHAAEGWRVVGVCVNNMVGIGRRRDELVAILEREVPLHPET